MMSHREILTFQFGNYSNYIGAHWWNLQESTFTYDPSEDSDINHDVLYREGLNYKRQSTYTPRLLLVDLNGTLKHLPAEGTLYGNVVNRVCNDTGEDSVKKLTEEISWKDSNIEVIAEPEVAKHEFQSDLDDPNVNVNEKEYNMSETVEAWTDYLYTRFHPRTVNLIKEYRYSPEKQTFDTFSNGTDVWKSNYFEDEFQDKIRQYMEECDCLQGFQMIFDCHDGFSGLATECAEHLRDEYSKSCFAVPVFPPKNIRFENGDFIMSDSIRVVNSALAFSHIIPHCSMFTPLCTRNRVWRELGSERKIPYLSYKADNFYQTSAILAAYLDTISLSYRLKNAPESSSLAGLCANMTNCGRKMTAAAFSMPFPMKCNEDLIDYLDNLDGDLFTQLSPNCKIGTNYVVQSLCVRGIGYDRLKRPLNQAEHQMKMAAYRCESVSQMIQLFLQCSNHASLAHVSSIQTPMPTKVPFAREMFDVSLNNKGFLTSCSLSDSDEKIQSVPTMATIQSSSEIGDTIETLCSQAKRIKIFKLHRYKEAGLEEEDYLSALENLSLFSENYEDSMKL